MGWRGQGGCERRIEVFVKIQKKMGGGGRVGFGGVRVDVIEEWKFLRKFTKKIGGGGVMGCSSGLGGQGGCERRIEVMVKIQKKKKTFFLGGGVVGRVGGGVGGRGSGVRVDVNEKLKFLEKFTK